QTPVEHLHLVQKGGVKLYLRDKEGLENLVDYRGEGASVGQLALVKGSKANLNVETVEDTFFFLVPGHLFLELLNTRPRFAQYYLKNFSESYLSQAFSEIRQRKVALQADSGLFLFTTPIGDIVRRAPVTIEASQTIQQAAVIMAREGVGSLLVERQGQACVGIVTDKDFRYKVVSQDLDHQAPVSTIMASPVLTIDSQAVCFDALLKMMRHQIHHLVVERQGAAMGMITSHDIMVLQGRSPFSLFKEIMAEATYEGLYGLSRKIPMVVRTLIEEGAKAGNITRMIAVLNDQILERLLTLLPKDLGPPPLPFCWLLMGSEGRREQTFRTDQDNALLYQDPPDPATAVKAEDYFRRFSQTAIEHLVGCGFPRCLGDIMASNPKWCRPYSVWQRYFDNWILRPEPREVLHATIFFDFRPGFGYHELGTKLREHLTETARRQDIFLRLLAQDCLTTRPPLSFFKNFIVEKDGEHKNTLDIKGRGLVPFVDFARLMSLKHGIRESNTLARYELLEKAGHISPELYADICDAYEFLMQIRLVHQLRQMERGDEPDNRINPGRLSELEKRTLKDAFSVIGNIQA
ncbi:MAG: cyclic nucleotide-binding/CBS domain-containing protein, partial [Deltaproteobacteria bacterium]|nr:cyclic nucleotide-binding/CBS domain-containing protein [Deltaproteobacteria bacterium]